MTSQLAVIALAVLGSSAATALMLGCYHATCARLSRAVQWPRDLSERIQALEHRIDRLDRVARPSHVEPIVPEVLRNPSVCSSQKPVRSPGARRASNSGQPLISVPSLNGEAQGAASTAPRELDRKFGSILHLADEGCSADSIARQTGQPIGQVELVLGLRKHLNLKA